MCPLLGRHTGELHAVLNDVVDFAVSHALGELGVQVRDAWIFVCANRSVAATINPVASGTLSQEKAPALARLPGRRWRTDWQRSVPFVELEKLRRKRAARISIVDGEEEARKPRHLSQNIANAPRAIRMSVATVVI